MPGNRPWLLLTIWLCGTFARLCAQSRAWHTNATPRRGCLPPQQHHLATPIFLRRGIAPLCPAQILGDALAILGKLSSRAESRAHLLFPRFLGARDAVRGICFGLSSRLETAAPSSATIRPRSG